MKKSSGVRRTAGGYQAGANGPCSAVNKGANTKLFHGNLPDRSSLEEFPMAFMLESGITDIKNSKIGDAKFQDGVKRSTTYRCIKQKDNTSKIDANCPSVKCLVSRSRVLTYYSSSRISCNGFGDPT
jgi:hypothetical protein